MVHQNAFAFKRQNVNQTLFDSEVNQSVYRNSALTWTINL